MDRELPNQSVEPIKPPDMKRAIVYIPEKDYYNLARKVKQRGYTVSSWFRLQADKLLGKEL